MVLVVVLAVFLTAILKKFLCNRGNYLHHLRKIKQHVTANVSLSFTLNSFEEKVYENVVK